MSHRSRHQSQPETAANAVDDVISQARRAFDVGVRQIWLAQRFDYDAIALAGPRRRRRARAGGRHVGGADQPSAAADPRRARADGAGGLARQLQPRPRPRCARTGRAGVRHVVAQPRRPLEGASADPPLDLRHRGSRPSRHRVHRSSRMAGGAGRGRPDSDVRRGHGSEGIAGDRRAGRRHAAVPGGSAHHRGLRRAHHQCGRGGSRTANAQGHRFGPGGGVRRRRRGAANSRRRS